MDISIEKLKMVIDELHDAEMSYRRQMNAFDKVFHAYLPIDTEGNDKRTMQRILENLDKEYCSIKKLRQTLSEVVRCYETAEKSITKSSSGAFGASAVLKKINIEETQRILRQFDIVIR